MYLYLKTVMSGKVPWTHIAEKQFFFFTIAFLSDPFGFLQLLFATFSLLVVLIAMQYGGRGEAIVCMVHYELNGRCK